MKTFNKKKLAALCASTPETDRKMATLGTFLPAHKFLKKSAKVGSVATYADHQPANGCRDHARAELRPAVDAAAEDASVLVARLRVVGRTAAHSDSPTGNLVHMIVLDLIAEAAAIENRLKQLQDAGF
jgi:hypothetical protein